VQFNKLDVASVDDSKRVGNSGACCIASAAYSIVLAESSSQAMIAMNHFNTFAAEAMQTYVQRAITAQYRMAMLQPMLQHEQPLYVCAL
jgi:hypothetical protein